MLRDLAESRTAAPARPPPEEGILAGTLAPALRVTAVTLVLTGIVYPLAVTGVAKVLFPRSAGGSLVTDERGSVVGSELLAQGFERAAYFQPRPSAAGQGWDAQASGGSNLGPTSRELREQAAARLDALARANPEAEGVPPVELVTASASGLDPHLSPAAARWQAPRVAAARGVAVDRVRAVVEEHVEDRDLGLLGEPRVNVLLLNLALDRRFGAPPAITAPDRSPAPRRRRGSRASGRAETLLDGGALARVHSTHTVRSRNSK
jgi:K+-transporting ATPase ATPase C chain